MLFHFLEDLHILLCAWFLSNKALNFVDIFCIRQLYTYVITF